MRVCLRTKKSLWSVMTSKMGRWCLFRENHRWLEIPAILWGWQRIKVRLMVWCTYFLLSTNRLSKRTVLLSYYLESGKYREALGVIDGLLQRSNSPAYVYYWRAEIMYQLAKYTAIWHAFETYLSRLSKTSSRLF